MPSREIRSIYLTGSGGKRWDSPIDYVPEISDVDIQVHFHRDAAWQEYIGNVAQALGIQQKVERRYLSKVEGPLHTPRPQLIILNKLIREQVFVFSPRETVQVMYGEDYPQADYDNPDDIRRQECARLAEDAAWLDHLPLHVVDRPGRYNWGSLRTLVWRVSPAGPRVLHVLGVGTKDAWSLNRTAVFSKLQELGEHNLAEDYSGFYLSCWEYFLSAYENTDAARSAIGAGAGVLTRAGEVAGAWLGGHPAASGD